MRCPAWLSTPLVLALSACGPGLVGGPSGEGEGEGIDVGPPPAGYDTSPVDGVAGECSTGQWWVLGNEESSNMHPGLDCIECHRREGEGPTYSVAGTVFQGLRDEDDCRGIPAAVVEIIGSDGTVAFTMTANSVGSFTSTRSLSGIAPYTARVTYGGNTIEMVGAQTEGSCNSCHTAAGLEGAPGRIVIP